MQYISQPESVPALDLLAWAMKAFGERFAIACSFQKEGMAIVDMAWRIDPQVRVFTLETGRLPAETHRMMDTVRERYGLEVEIVRPEPSEVAEMVALYGRDLFRDSVDLRHLCCTVRKVRPLERKLRDLEAWATGLRREQSPDRAATPKLERRDGLVKINPIADWTSQQVEDYIRLHDVPVHPLYARGFSSIGCEPCTRALSPGESGRDGRWWWEQEGPKECGIHINAAGVVQRNQAAASNEPPTHDGFTLWLTGLSGAGKSTISGLLEQRLRDQGARVEVLDGDVVRSRLSPDLGFSRADRDENIRRIGYLCDLLSRNGVIAIAAAISPYEAVRAELRASIRNFVEVYVECPIEVLAERDVKGLYRKALAGEIANFTGISDPYEPPATPEVTVNSSTETPAESAGRIWATLERLGLIRFDRPALSHQ